MRERLLDKKTIPSFEEMVSYCDTCKDLFLQIHQLMNKDYIQWEIKFPYGNKYGWCISYHNEKKKLICNLFPECNSCTMMMRLDDKQFMLHYDTYSSKTKNLIDHRYPCSNGGWIHYQVINEIDFKDLSDLLYIKLNSTKK